MAVPVPGAGVCHCGGKQSASTRRVLPLAPWPPRRVSDAGAGDPRMSLRLGRAGPRIGVEPGRKEAGTAVAC